MKNVAVRIIIAAVTVVGFCSIQVFSGGRETSSAFPVVRFRLDSSQSKFIVHANRSGLAWFKGHSHRIAAKDFTGTAELDLTAVNPASLEMSVRANSLEETDPVFTADQKKIINKEVNDLVLETEKYPEITFRSTGVKGSLVSGKFDVRITGDLTLHGVTKQVVIPAIVTIDGDSFRATGDFEIDRKDFNVNATEAFHGFVKVKHHLTFEFDIVGKRV